MIDIKNLSVSYGKKEKPIIENLSLCLEEGKLGILLGPNGAGKSTLIKTIAGILKPLEGDITVGDVSQKNASKKKWSQLIAYVPQSVQPVDLSVYETVLLGRLPYFRVGPREEDHVATETVLEKMGLRALSHRIVSSLSGGERQKVAIARALNQGAKTLLFDEPTSSLDIKNELGVLFEAKRLAKEEGYTVLLAIHDLNFAKDSGDAFFFMKNGSLVYQGGKEVFQPKQVKDVFGVSSRVVQVEEHEILIFEGKNK